MNSLWKLLYGNQDKTDSHIDPIPPNPHTEINEKNDLITDTDTLSGEQPLIDSSIAESIVPSITESIPSTSSINTPNIKFNWEQSPSPSTNQSKLYNRNLKRLDAIHSLTYQKNKIRKRNAQQQIAIKYIKHFQEATEKGYKGTEQEFTELYEYANKVMKQTRDFSIETPRKGSNTPYKIRTSFSPSIPSTPQTTYNHASTYQTPYNHSDNISTVESHVPWLNALRNQIKQTLQSKPITFESIKSETPVYDKLVKNQIDSIETIKQKIKELKTPKKVDEIIIPIPDIEIVNKTLYSGNEDDLIVKEFSIEMMRRDLQTLLPGTWLNDQVMNFYGELVMSRISNNHSEYVSRNNNTTQTYPNIHFYNSFFYSRLKDGYEKVKRWSKKFDTFSKDYLIFPIHLGMHWTCGRINFLKKRIEYYDSLHGNNTTYFKLMRDYLKSEHLDKKKMEFDLSEWVDYCPKDIPCQMNGYDCGVFSCIFVEHLSRDAPFRFSQEQMPYYRNRIVYEIVNSKLLNS